MNNKLIYFAKFFGANPELLETYKKQLMELFRGEYASAHFKKLKGHNLYSVRLNDSDRLLFTTQKIEGQESLVLLEAVLNHDLKKSRFMQKHVLRAFMENQTEELPEFISEDDFIDVDTLPVMPTAESFKSVEYYDRQFIVLNEKQNEALIKPLPLVVSGPAGSGKSCEALAVLKQYVDNPVANHESRPLRKIVYLTQSRFLKQKMEAIWKETPQPSDEAAAQAANVRFMTYDEFLEQKNILSPAHKLVGKEKFMEWAKVNFPRQTIDPEDLYQEFRLISACERKEEYQEMGEKQSRFHKQDETQDLIWKAFVKYKKDLHDQGLIDPAFFRLPDRVWDDIDCMVVDEGQDFSPLQLIQLARLTKERKICYFMDSHQSLYDDKSLRPYLMHRLNQLFKKEVAHVALPCTYRCPEAVTQFANGLIRAKQKLVHGVADRQECPQIRGAENQGEGTVHWLQEQDLDKVDLKNLFRSTQFAIVTPKAFLAEAKKRFPQARIILTVEEIKGLEYPYVLGYRLPDEPIYEEADKALAAEDASKEVKNRAIPGQGQDKFGPPFNHLITAATRAKDTFIMVSNLPEHNLKHIRAYAMRDVKCAKINISAIESSQEDWNEEIKRQLERGNKRVAEEIAASLAQPDAPAIEEPKPAPAAAASSSTGTHRKKNFKKKKNKAENTATVTTKVTEAFDMEVYKYQCLLRKQNLEKILSLVVIQEILKDDTKWRNFYRACQLYLEEQKGGKLLPIFKLLNHTQLQETERGSRLIQLILSHTFYVPAVNPDELTTAVLNKNHRRVTELIKAGANVNLCDRKGGIALYVAAQIGDVNCLREILSAPGCNINIPDYLGRTALFMAADLGYVEVVKQLLKAGANAELPTFGDKGVTPLQAAAQKGHLEMVQTLLQSPVDVNQPAPSGITALHVAAAYKCTSVIRELLRHRAELNLRDGTGATPLFLAAEYGDIDGFRELLKTKHCDVNIPNNSGETPLHAAVRNNHIMMVKELLKAGADTGLLSNNGTESGLALTFAVINNHIEVLKLLLQHQQCNVNQGNKYGQTALHAASSHGQQTAVEELLKAGAEVNLADNRGVTSLMFAATKGHNQTVRILLRSKAALNTQNVEGGTALSVACLDKHAGTVQTLISSGADVNLPDNYGITPLSITVKNGDIRSFQLILNSGRCNVNIPDKSGLTPLHIAALQNDLVMVRELLKAGANTDLVAGEPSSGTPIHIAAQHDNVELMKMLLPHTNNIDQVNLKDMTALHVASALGQTAVVKELLHAGADIDLAHKTLTPLILASTKGHLQTVRTLLQRNAAVDKQTAESTTALTHACHSKQASVVLELISHGADVNLPDQNGETSLFYTVRNGDLDCFKAVLGSGKCNVNIASKSGGTALHLAASMGRELMVKELLEAGARVDFSYGESGGSPLQYAASNGHVEIVKMLLARGCNVNQTNVSGMTALYVAAGNGRALVIEELLLRGAEIDLADRHGITPLIGAAKTGQLESVRILLRNNAGIEKHTNDGLTPLLAACEKKHASVVHELLDAGANVNANTAGGKTALRYSPLGLAVLAADQAVVKLLLARGANVAMECSVPIKYLDIHLVRNPECAAYVKRYLEDNKSRINDGFISATAEQLAELFGYKEIAQLIASAGKVRESITVPGTLFQRRPIDTQKTSKSALVP